MPSPVSSDGFMATLVRSAADSLDLTANRLPRVEGSAPFFTVADLYCGAGGLSLGALFASVEIGHSAKFLLAADRDQHALGVYSRNLRPLKKMADDVGMFVDFQIDTVGTEP
jgi:predicted RNA methylase